MMRWLVVLLLLLPSLHVRAEGTVNAQPGFSIAAQSATTVGCPNNFVGTQSAAITCERANYLASYTYKTGCGGAVFQYNWPGNTYQYNMVCSDGNNGLQIFSGAGSVCPANSTGTTSCICNTDYVPNAGATACVYVQPPATCSSAVGTVFQDGYYDLGTSDAGVMPATVCQSGCVANFDGYGSAVARTTISGVYHYYAKGTYSNSATSYDGSCAPNTPAGVQNSIGATVPNPTCGVDQSLGWVNGIPLCVNSSSTSTSTPPVSTTSTSTTETNASGVTTKTTQDNTASGGSTTTTTIVNPNGTSTTTTASSTNPETSSMFCQHYPSDPSCKRQSECELNPDSIGCLDAGTPTDSEVIGNLNVNVAVTPHDFGITAGCPADRVFDVQGNQVTFSFSTYCEFLNLIRPIVLAVAWLGAAFIVLGS